MSLAEAKELCRIGEGNENIKNISFEISKKGVYGFLAKTEEEGRALCELLAGLCEADGGSLTYKDREMFISPKETAEIKRKISYVPQKCFYDEDMTAFEVLDLVGKSRRIDPDKRYRQIKEALELTALSAKKDVLVGELSLSQKKRLSIAAALLGNPDVLVMDEPLQYLDKQQAEGIRSLMGMLSGKKVIIFFSIRPSDIEELSTNIAFLSGGELVLWEDAVELRQKIEENKLGSLKNVFEALTEKEGEEN